MCGEDNMSSDQHQLHVIVSGRVQGVSFRYFTRQRALQLGIRGWVQNNTDGTVEVKAQGTKEQLEGLLSFLHVGSPGSHVQNVKVEWESFTHQLQPFNIRYPSYVS